MPPTDAPEDGPPGHGSTPAAPLPPDAVLTTSPAPAAPGLLASLPATSTVLDEAGDEDIDQEVEEAIEGAIDGSTEEAAEQAAEGAVPFTVMVLIIGVVASLCEFLRNISPTMTNAVIGGSLYIVDLIFFTGYYEPLKKSKPFGWIITTLEGYFTTSTQVTTSSVATLFNNHEMPAVIPLHATPVNFPAGTTSSLQKMRYMNRTPQYITVLLGSDSRCGSHLISIVRSLGDCPDYQDNSTSTLFIGYKRDFAPEEETQSYLSFSSPSSHSWETDIRDVIQGLPGVKINVINFINDKKDYTTGSESFLSFITSVDGAKALSLNQIRLVTSGWALSPLLSFLTNVTNLLVSRNQILPRKKEVSDLLNRIQKATNSTQVVIYAIPQLYGLRETTGQLDLLPFTVESLLMTLYGLLVSAFYIPIFPLVSKVFPVLWLDYHSLAVAILEETPVKTNDNVTILYGRDIFELSTLFYKAHNKEVNRRLLFKRSRFAFPGTFLRVLLGPYMDQDDENVPLIQN